MTSDPQMTASVDQAIAAAREGAAWMAGYQQDKGGEIQWKDGPGSPLVTAFRTRLASGLMNGGIVPCRHLLAGTHMFWTPYHPDQLRCGQCHNAKEREIAGTPEDHRCDGCQRLFPGAIHPRAILLPATVRSAGLVTGPVTISFGLCDACRKSDEG